MMSPILMKMAMRMNPMMTQQQIMGMIQQNMPMMIGIGILEHYCFSLKREVFFVVIGSIVAAVILFLFY